MTEEQINATIHDALENAIKCPRCNDPECVYNSIPNYCADLNAMHKALKTLKPDQLWDVAYSLPMETMLGFMATARELAETFLLVIGKWEGPTTEESSVIQEEDK